MLMAVNRLIKEDGQLAHRIRRQACGTLLFWNAMLNQHDQFRGKYVWHSSGKDNGVAVVWLDQEGEKVNKLGGYLVEAFNNLLENLQNDADVTSAVLISGKPDTFIAGADLDFVFALEEPENEKLSRQGQAIMDRIARLPTNRCGDSRKWRSAVGWAWRWLAITASPAIRRNDFGL
ncbi:MAG: hypothetical protein R3C26_00635 [Calditrichia bacterium]